MIFHCLMVFKARVKLCSCLGNVDPRVFHLSPHQKGSAFHIDWSDLTLRNIVSECKELLFGLGRWWPRERGCCLWEKGSIIAGQERVNRLANSVLFPSLAKSTFGFSLSDNLSTRTSTIKKLYRIWDTYKLSHKITWYTFRKREHTSEQDTWQYDQRSRQL